MPARLELVRRGTAGVTSGPPRPPAPPSLHAVEARQLIEGWLETSFIGKGDAVEDLVHRIAALLARRDARLEPTVPVGDQPLFSGR